ncbi:probable ATP-dependent helicase PF08_0048 [Aphidius gifuensis]|uniref:probable ATP-dependent helicase PF08_0048 n=1 Tax=Aphidius gifuensis TaxID=684658 RepID=UPI001CDC581F|nr:probable ATP-dependent helicase PF08_0048 [Aphidius gifuensis]
MVIFMKKIINSNKHKVAVEKSKVESIKIVTQEATRDSGYVNNSDQLNKQQQQQQQRVDKVHNQDNMLSKRRKKSVDEIHSKKMFKADNKKNNCDESSYAINIQIASPNKNLIDKLHMADFIEEEENIFIEESITIKDEMFCSNKVIENVDHQKSTRIRTGSLAPKKYNFYTEGDDKLSSTTDENDPDKKTRVVKLAREHPTWSLNMLREHSGCKNIKDRCQIGMWKNQIERGGTEETSFIEQSITIKDEMLPVTDDSIDVDEMNNSNDHSIGPVIKSNGISNLFNGNNQNRSNKVIKNVDHQKNTRISTGSLASKKYSVYTEEDDKLSSPADKNHLDADWLRKRSGCEGIRQRSQVEEWKKQGGSIREKMNFMEQFDKHQLETTDQELFTDSFNFCWELLKSKEYYLSERETDIFSKMSLNYGQDMYDAMMIIINKIIKSNEHKSKVESIKIVTAEATCDSGYDDNCDQLDQQQKQQQVDKEKKLFTKDNITTKDEIVSDDLIDVSKINIWNDHSYALDIKSNEISNFSKDNNQSRSNEIIENVDYQKNTRIRTGSLAPKKYSVHTKEDDDLSFTIDGNYLDNDDNVDVEDDDDDFHLYVDDNDDDDNDNSLSQSKKRDGKIKITSGFSFEEKKRVVKLATENPTWSLDLLREQSGCKNIRLRKQVEKWKKHVQQGGTNREKMNRLCNVP